MNPDPISPSLRVATETDDAKRDAAPAAVTAAAGPGRMVRAARERAKLGIEELATQTRLTRAVLEALESEDFSTLNEAVYVRGYYRKCAKVLKLSEAELIGAYDKLLGPKAPPMPTKLMLGGGGSTMGSMRGSTGRRSSGPSLPLVLVIALAIGVGIWFAVHDAGRLVPSMVLEIPAASSSAAPAIEPRPEPAPAAAAGLEAQPPVPASEFAAPTPVLKEATQLGITTALTPAAAGEVPPPAAVSPAVSAAAGALIMDFRSNSWVRIEDADGQLLLSGTVHAGDHQVLRGRTPYSLFIGYAPGVTIEFDGKPFDLAPHIRQNSTVRISLPYVAPATPEATTTPAPSPR